MQGVTHLANPRYNGVIGNNGHFRCKNLQSSKFLQFGIGQPQHNPYHGPPSFEREKIAHTWSTNDFDVFCLLDILEIHNLIIKFF
jgi:hypothetical protein